ncbi:MAG: methylmalonyl Co-A mutase-associated GTPase MeaB [Magnetococcales bacterium]|nr:methylmalonyl Co-A mutase-associated GTPase MeaB [Magnetococcales bacterium]
MTGFSTESHVQGVRGGDRRLLAKTITLVESTRTIDNERAAAVLSALQPHTGDSFRIGITGPPGVGKSTFIEALGMALITQGKRLAVLAVDPSSSRSGGSLLGDKTRMTQLSVHPQAFVRPSPAGETLGGVARKTRESILVLEAAGFDTIIVETVGVGQSEVAVASMVDCFVLLALPNAGDDLQGIKRGIMELADVLVVNKADGTMMEPAHTAARLLRQALTLQNPLTPDWSPPVLLASALANTGLAEFIATLETFRTTMIASGEMERKRRRQSRHWMWELIDEGLKRRFTHHLRVRQLLPDLEEAVTRGRMTPIAAADQLLSAYTDKNLA